MCTLTYLLTENGYELFFNRDEQHSRPLAKPPEFNHDYKAIYPIDPQGHGTWIAVNQSGLTLALLNLYQNINHAAHNIFLSRGQLILSLLKSTKGIIDQLKSVDLSVYQPFQLCVFPENLTKHRNRIKVYQWNGLKLGEGDSQLPITSSGVDFKKVYKKRKKRFQQLVDENKPKTKQLMAFHLSREAEGKHSVNMHRPDAKTVNISHIIVSQDITFHYIDNTLGTIQTRQCGRKKSMAEIN